MKVVLIFTERRKSTEKEEKRERNRRGKPEQRRGGIHEFSCWYLLKEHSQVRALQIFCSYFSLHCSSCIFPVVFGFHSLFGCEYSAIFSFSLNSFEDILYMSSSESCSCSLSFPLFIAQAPEMRLNIFAIWSFLFVSSLGFTLFFPLLFVLPYTLF